jgi:GT2 family glycosyltransferase
MEAAMSGAKNNQTTPVSIVIPVCDRADMTRRCLESIRRHTCGSEYEIIVVDNGSTDGSTGELRDLHDEGRISGIFNGRDHGFAAACNQGAEIARHPYVLFLSNDTEVSPGWLRPLVETLDMDAKAGAAGSKLLYPDGTIQHAGAALLRRQLPGGEVLDAVHLCLRKPSHFAPAGQPQLVRCLTAACLLVRREAFERVGRFEEGYWNGYEDVDLCLALENDGWDLVYRPESVVVHYEAPGDEERHARTRENLELLNERWFDATLPDYYVDIDGTHVPAPEFSIRTYAPPRLRFVREEAAGASTATVVVLTHNALDATRLCVESLLARTDARHELLFVDNASTDGTFDYLRGLCAAHERCRAIYNPENLGVAAGANLGFAHASGDHLVLMNSDVVVTEGWLETLIRAAEDHPQAGLVGPVTNSVAGVQKLPRVGYDQESLADLDLFARMHGQATRGNDELVMWLSGFCLLVKRDLLARIGGFDERFGRGNFEDNDFCLRSFLAGFQALVATDCFVHHFGGLSYEDAGVDYEAELEEKWETFKDKWNVPMGTPFGGDIGLERILVSGFDSVLHFQPLPRSRTIETVTPAPADRERALVRGEDAFDDGRIGDAETYFRWALHWDESDSRAVNNLAVTLWKAGRRDESIALLEDLARRDPDDADAAWNLREIRADIESATAPTSEDAPAEHTNPRETPVV